MLSQEDRRRLEAIERRLQSEDPDLAHLLVRWPEPPAVRRARCIAAAAVVLGALAVLAGLLVAGPAVFLPGAAVVLAGWIRLRRLDRRGEQPPTGAGTGEVP